MLGRVTASSVPESGTTTYNYPTGTGSCAGDPTVVCSKTDANGSTITYSYDLLNRLTQKSYSDGTPASVFIYDLGNITLGTQHFITSNVVGRLSIMCELVPGACQSTTGYSYDAMGRTVETLTHTSSSGSNVYSTSSNMTSLAISLR
jgi:YD repeat-containing protein